MDLGPYPHNVKGIADELGDMLADDLRETALGLVDACLAETMDIDEKAVAFLAKTPSQRDRVVAKLAHREAATLILRARYHGLVSSLAMTFAENFAYVRGRGYRDAAAYGARVALRASLRPDRDDLMGYWSSGRRYF